MPSPSITLSRSRAYLSGCRIDSPGTAIDRCVCSVLRYWTRTWDSRLWGVNGAHGPGVPPAQSPARDLTCSTTESRLTPPATLTTMLLGV